MTNPFQSPLNYLLLILLFDFVLIFPYFVDVGVSHGKGPFYVISDISHSGKLGKDRTWVVFFTLRQELSIQTILVTQLIFLFDIKGILTLLKWFYTSTPSGKINFLIDEC